jgi:cobalt/nickel transport system ATP-binding protein
MSADLVSGDVGSRDVGSGDVVTGDVGSGDVVSGDVGSSVLDFRDVVVRYDDVVPPALEHCTFDVRAGERVALIGANGSGKTTILMASVALVPHRGAIRVCGELLDTARPERARSQVGVLFSMPEDQLLFPRVLDDVAFSLTSRGVATGEALQRAREALDSLDAGHLADRSPYRMSRGQRLRAALAGTLVTQPPLLLLDEPSGGLDPAGRRLLIRHLGALSSAMLIATHDIDFAAQCCHRWLLVDAGRIAATGSNFSDIAL